MAVKKFEFVALAVLFVLGTTLCRANLGDTEAQCIAKYGDESDAQDGLGYDVVGDRAATFHFKTAKGSFDIRITFLRGLVCHEVITNSDSSHGVSHDQMKAFLDSESAGLEWRKGKSIYRTDNAGTTYGAEDWQRSDGANAKFYMSGKSDAQTFSGELDLSTKQYTVAQDYFNKQDGVH